jgi:hypothetical protein
MPYSRALDREVQGAGGREILREVIRMCYDVSMQIDTYLAPLDAGRVSRVLKKLNSGGLTDYALTGGLALEASLGSSSGRPRPLNDIDIVVSGFADIPSSLGEAFLACAAERNRKVA